MHTVAKLTDEIWKRQNLHRIFAADFKKRLPIFKKKYPIIKKITCRRTLKWTIDYIITRIRESDMLNL